MTIFGRDAEIERLGALVAGWRSSGGLRVIGLVGQPGSGKTTLLSPLADRLRSEPGVQGRLSGDLQIDDDEERRNLWWGVRLTAPVRGRETSSHCALATHKQWLLRELQRTSGVLHSFGGLREAKSILGSSAQDLILDAVGGMVPGLSTAKTIGTALFRALKYRDEQEQARLRGDGLDPQLYASLVETVLADIEVVAAPTKLALPVVIAIDDAQFLDADPATATMLRELISRARADGWWLCLAFTQWEDSWLRGEGLRPLLEGVPVEIIAVENLTESWRIVMERAPGVGEDDARAVAAMVGDNPRAVGELADYLVRHPRFFASRSSAGPLRTDWRDLVPEDVISLETLVRDRFELLPETSRRLLVAAAAAGHRFSRSVSARVAGVEPGDAVGDLDRIHARETFLETLDPRIGEFRIPVYHRIVAAQADDYYDQGRLNRSLLEEAFAFVIASRRWRPPTPHPDAEHGEPEELAAAMRDPAFKAEHAARVEAWAAEQTAGPPPSEFDLLDAPDQLLLLDLLLNHHDPDDQDSRRSHAALTAHRALVRYEAGDWTGAVEDGLRYAAAYEAEPAVHGVFTVIMRVDLGRLARFPELEQALQPFVETEDRHWTDWSAMAEPQMRAAIDEYAKVAEEHGHELAEEQRQELTAFVASMRALCEARFVHLPRSSEVAEEFQRIAADHPDATYDDEEGRPTVREESLPGLRERLGAVRTEALRLLPLLAGHDGSHLELLVAVVDVILEPGDDTVRRLGGTLSSLPGAAPLHAPSLWMLLMWWRRTDAADLVLQHALARAEGVGAVETGYAFLQLLRSGFARIPSDPTRQLALFAQGWAGMKGRLEGVDYPQLRELDAAVREFLGGDAGGGADAGIAEP